MAMLAGKASIAQPTFATRLAAGAMVAVVVGTTVYLAARYASLPGVLAVHFAPNGRPNGWQFKTPARVLMPVLVQIALALTLGAIGALLLSRPGDAGDANPGDEMAPDVRAAVAAAEAVVLIALIWVAFQSYAAGALVGMWTAERAGLGRWYTLLGGVCAVGTCAVSVRAHLQLGRPTPRPFVAEHWRLGQLYNNADDPALFVPTRDGRRWTLNFGRPVAAALLGIILLIGVLVPSVILGLMLRGT
jgi:uncharacterized membrane protein